MTISPLLSGVTYGRGRAVFETIAVSFFPARLRLASSPPRTTALRLRDIDAAALIGALLADATLQKA